MNLETKIAALLTGQRKTLSVAESCSGGLLGHRLTNIPGSSAFFKLGVVSYSNEAKQNLLDVPETTLKCHGAVSEPVAEAMARGVRKAGKTDYGISITGLAGPDGGSAKKPVGLTYIAVSSGIETFCLKCVFQGTRLQIKTQAVSQALQLLKKILSYE